MAACSMLAVRRQKKPSHHRCVHMTTSSPDDKAHSALQIALAHQRLMSVSTKYGIYSGIHPTSDLCTSEHNFNWILSATGNQCNSWRAGVTWSRLEQYTSRRVGPTETMPEWTLDNQPAQRYSSPNATGPAVP